MKTPRLVRQSKTKPIKYFLEPPSRFKCDGQFIKLVKLKNEWVLDRDYVNCYSHDELQIIIKELKRLNKK